MRFTHYPTTGVRLDDLKGVILSCPAFPKMKWLVPHNITATSWQVVNLHTGNVSDEPHYNTLIDWIDRGYVTITYHPSPAEHDALLVRGQLRSGTFA